MNLALALYPVQMKKRPGDDAFHEADESVLEIMANRVLIGCCSCAANCFHGDSDAETLEEGVP